FDVFPLVGSSIAAQILFFDIRTKFCEASSFFRLLNFMLVCQLEIFALSALHRGFGGKQTITGLIEADPVFEDCLFACLLKTDASTFRVLTEQAGLSSESRQVSSHTVLMERIEGRGVVFTREWRKNLKLWLGDHDRLRNSNSLSDETGVYR